MLPDHRHQTRTQPPVVGVVDGDVLDGRTEACSQEGTSHAASVRRSDPHIAGMVAALPPA